MRTAHLESRSDGPYIQMWLVDESGNRLTDEDVVQGWDDLSIVGISVMRKMDCPAELPVFAVITEITEDSVCLNKNIWLAKDRVHEFYQLD